MRSAYIKAVLFLSMALTLCVYAPGPAVAHDNCCSCPATVQRVSNEEWWALPTPAGQQGIWPTRQRLIQHVKDELFAQRVWMISVFWEDNVLAAMMLMSEEITATVMKQMQIIGSFMDAQHQMESQQIIQEIRAQAHKDYQPSIGMCEFASGMKSMAASERKAEYNALLMGQRQQDRHLGTAFTSTRTGQDSDRENRAAQFRWEYCDPADNNSGLGRMCDGVASPARFNKDIDYTRTVAVPKTMQVDFTDSVTTNDEKDIMALAVSLYGQDVFERFPSRSLRNLSNLEMNRMQATYLDMRSVLAKRSVAENSFNALTSLKSNGTPGSSEFLEALLAELGISDTDPLDLFGNKSGPSEAEKFIGTNPSYYAQLEMLGKTIYQNPDFYTNLYDKPANVDRKMVSMQAIGMMQKFDTLKSKMRYESSLSVLLELSVMKMQEEIENQMNVAQPEGQRAN